MTSDAIRTLAKGGKSAAAREAIRRHAEQVQQDYARISGDESLSDKGRHWQLASAYSQHSAALERELSGMASDVRSADRDDAEKVFGTRGLRGDEASLIIARRDADDRVAEISDSGELQTLLNRATRSGDEVMARAIVQRAVEIGDNVTAEAFRASRPEVEDAVERLWNAERAQHDSLGFTMEMANMLPGELAHLGREQIETLAAEAQPASQIEPERAPYVYDAQNGMAGFFG